MQLIYTSVKRKGACTRGAWENSSTAWEGRDKSGFWKGRTEENSLICSLPDMFRAPQLLRRERVEVGSFESEEEWEVFKQDPHTKVNFPLVGHVTSIICTFYIIPLVLKKTF